MLALFAGTPAHAHHVMGGATPGTFLQGFLSGLGHPIIGLDHLAFIAAMGLVVGAAGLNLAIPGLFVALSAVGVGLHVWGIVLPASEMIVAVSVLLIGILAAAGRAFPTALWIALFAIAGLFHGYTFGESIVGAESTPLAAYLLGLVVVQSALSIGIATVARRSAAHTISVRLAGSAIAGIGIALLGGFILPA